MAIPWTFRSIPWALGAIPRSLIAIPYDVGARYFYGIRGYLVAVWNSPIGSRAFEVVPQSLEAVLQTLWATP